MQNVHAGGAEGPRVRSRSGARAQGELICFLNRAQLPNQTKDETITNYTTQQQHKLQQQQQQQYVPLPPQQRCVSVCSTAAGHIAQLRGVDLYCPPCPL